MNSEEFKNQYQTTIQQSLVRLQTAAILTTQLSVTIITIAQDLQSLSLIVEEFIAEINLNNKET